MARAPLDPSAFDSSEAYCDALRRLPWWHPCEELALLIEQLSWAEEGQAEAEAQYRSECALFGDAGPGQGLALHNGARLIADLRRRIEVCRRIVANQQRQTA